MLALYTVPGRERINDLVIDPEGDRLYLAISDGRIQETDLLISTPPQTIFQWSGYAYGVAVDTLCEAVYWMDGRNRVINRAKLDGTLTETIINSDDYQRAGTMRLLLAGDNLDRCATDCNDNGISDIQDVLDGTSSDCNDNRVPDECEGDCNENGVPDPCDITDGTSTDHNGNGVPDECDPIIYDYELVIPEVSDGGAVNSLGQIAYYDDDNGLQLWDDGQTTLKLRYRTYDILVRHETHLNDAGQIAFRIYQGEQARILRIEPGQTADDYEDFTVIAKTTGNPFSELPGLGALTNDGRVAFSASGPGLPRTTVIGDGTGSIYDLNSYEVPFPTELFGRSENLPLLTTDGLGRTDDR